MITPDISTALKMIPTCPVCGSQATIPLCEVAGYRIWRCPHSATDFVWPMPADQFLANFYNRQEWFEQGDKGGYDDYDRQTAYVLPLYRAFLDEFEKSTSGRYILDIGCAYGTHLSIAYERGWKCYGVELSEHARLIAQKRHGNDIVITDRIDALPSLTFDLILLFDVIEHLKNPYSLFFDLYRNGFIGDDTRIIITTPNARSYEGVSHPDTWLYRTPPSHLVFYSGESLQTLLMRLHCSDIEVSGIYPSRKDAPSSYTDEYFILNRSLAKFTGLFCKARGGDFRSFLRKHYSSSSSREIPQSEYLSRYFYARHWTHGGNVLDFVCQSGDGMSILAENARSVVGFSIDDYAMKWAEHYYQIPHISFENDFARLEERSFDIVTCFDLLEHLDDNARALLLSTLNRFVVQSGMVIFSFSNCEDVACGHIGEQGRKRFNAISLREMLHPFFRHVRVLKQWVRQQVVIGDDAVTYRTTVEEVLSGEPATLSTNGEPVAFLALCSDVPITDVQGGIYKIYQGSTYQDSPQSLPYHRAATGYQIAYFGLIDKTERENEELQDALAGKEAALLEQGQTIEILQNNLSERDTAIERFQKDLHTAGQTIVELSAKQDALEEEIAVLHQELIGKNADIAAKNADIAAKTNEIQAFKQSKLFRLRHTLLEEPLSARKIAKILYLAGALTTPESIKRHLRRPVMRMKSLFPSSSPALERFRPYNVRILETPRESRPRIVHALANFMTGGSSRLVIDLIEHLGHRYEQEVITSHIPSPPHYSGLEIREFSHLIDPRPVMEYLRRFNPALLHIHYWGECDKGWYEQIFSAGKQFGCKIVENINTPVEPFFFPSVSRYVYVSDYVKHEFGDGNDKSITIYPGSDFSLFARQNIEEAPDDCIGMVYRLEPDKLNERSIDVFLKVVKRRPATKILIVGGGSLLKTYIKKARLHGVYGAFEFTDYVSYAALPDLYRRMSVFVAPVWKESFGQVSPFAMNMGIPVVGYDIGALAEIIGDRKLLAPPGDSDRLADITMDLLDDRARRITIGRRNQQRAQSLFSVEAMIKHYTNLYTDVLGDPDSLGN